MCFSYLSDVERCVYVFVDNKIVFNVGWDSEFFLIEFGDLVDLLLVIDIDLEIIGFVIGEIDILLFDYEVFVLF